MTKLKTPEYYLDEVAKEVNYNSFTDMIEKRAQYGSVKVTVKLISESVKEAILRHSKEACEVQRKLCAEEAKSWISYDEVLERSYVDKQSILNAKSPIE